MAAGKKQKPWWRIVTIRPNESFTGAVVSETLRKLLNAYPLGDRDWPLDVMCEAADALDAQARLIEEAREVVLFLANAADEFGVRHLDSDWISPEAEALQKATASARAFLTTLPAKTGETS